MLHVIDVAIQWTYEDIKLNISEEKYDLGGVHKAAILKAPLSSV